jgi:hypothetical protein
MLDGVGGGAWEMWLERFESGELGTDTKTAPETGAVLATRITTTYLPPEGNE